MIRPSYRMWVRFAIRNLLFQLANNYKEKDMRVYKCTVRLILNSDPIKHER